MLTLDIDVGSQVAILKSNTLCSHINEIFLPMQPPQIHLTDSSEMVSLYGYYLKHYIVGKMYYSEERHNFEIVTLRIILMLR